MKFTHKQICTKSGIVDIGETYLYKEGFFMAYVEVIVNKSDENGIGFKLKIHNILAPEPFFSVGTEFDCWTYKEMDLSDTWRLYDVDACRRV